MPIGAVRRVSCAFMVIAAAGPAAACIDNKLSAPEDVNLVSHGDGRTLGPFGLEQRLTLRMEPAPTVSPYTAQLIVTSKVVNTGSSPVRVTARECLIMDTDVESTARLDRFEPTISCGAVSSTRDLAVGESTSTMEVRFGVRSGPGTYTLRLRHALSPEFRGEVSFTVP